MTDLPPPRIRQVVLDCLDARRSAEFWRQLLGLVYRAGHEPPGPGGADAAGRDWLNLRTPDGAPSLAFQQVGGLQSSTWPDDRVPQQLHLDLSVPSIEAGNVAHDRVLALGGLLIADRSHDQREPLRVYADPDGHPFCIFLVTD